MFYSIALVLVLWLFESYLFVHIYYSSVRSIDVVCALQIKLEWSGLVKLERIKPGSKIIPKM